MQELYTEAADNVSELSNLEEFYRNSEVAEKHRLKYLSTEKWDNKSCYLLKGLITKNEFLQGVPIFVQKAPSQRDDTYLIFFGSGDYKLYCLNPRTLKEILNSDSVEIKNILHEAATGAEKAQRGQARS